MASHFELGQCQCVCLDLHGECSFLRLELENFCVSKSSPRSLYESGSRESAAISDDGFEEKPERVPSLKDAGSLGGQEFAFIGLIPVKMARPAHNSGSVLLVEQSFSFAINASDFVHLMSKGRIVRESIPKELIENKEVRESYLGI